MRPNYVGLIVLLIAGATLNLATAWMCATWLRIGGLRTSVISTIGNLKHVTVTDCRFGVSRINTAQFSDLTLDQSGNILIARWSGDGKEHGEIQAGLPMRSFTCANYGEISIELGSSRIGMNKTGMNPIIGGIERAADSSTGAWRALPYRPLWLGFFVNTAFWSMLSWLIAIVVITWRTHRRVQRGLCVACGYDISGAPHDVCPECGSVVVRKIPHTHLINFSSPSFDGAADASRTMPAAPAE